VPPYETCALSIWLPMTAFVKASCLSQSSWSNFECAQVEAGGMVGVFVELGCPRDRCRTFSKKATQAVDYSGFGCSG
jgi:hypothetical protein